MNGALIKFRFYLIPAIAIFMFIFSSILLLFCLCNSNTALLTFLLGYISTLRNNVRSRAWGAAIGCSYRVERCCIVKVVKSLDRFSVFSIVALWSSYGIPVTLLDLISMMIV